MRFWGKTTIPVLAYTFMVFSIFILNRILPVCRLSEAQENVLFMLSIGSIFVLCFPMISLARSVRAHLHNGWGISFYILLLLIQVPAYWSIMGRSHDIGRLHWQFHGSVERIYRQGSYQAAAIDLAGKAYVFFPEGLWYRLQVGDKLEKTGCGNQLLLNEQPVVFELY